MTSSRLLARNTALNLFAQIAPLFVAVFAVPVLIRSLGPGRFGVLTLAWALIGYFGLFDFGIGRALTQAASEALGRNDHERLTEIGSTAMAAMFVLGSVGALIVAALTPWLAYHVLKMDDALRPEAARSFYLLALSLPFVLSTLGFRGLFEAHQHFGLATALRMPYSLFNFVGPLLILPFTNNLVAIVGILVFGRIATWVAHLILGLRRYPWLRVTSFRNVSTILPLVRVGGWMTVSNIISPMMVNLDRFLIGALLSMSAVAFYVTPYEVVTKLLFVPAAILGVFFPAFASTFVQDRARTASILDRATRLMVLSLFPVVFVLVTFAREGLLVWVGPDFARESAVVLQLLAIGVFINSLGQVSFGLLQATGRPDLTAKLHMFELPLYAGMIYLFATRLGLAGVALAWTARIAIDTAVLCWLTKRQLAEATPALARAALAVTLLTGILAIAAIPSSLAVRAIGGSVVLLGFVATAWLVILHPSERDVIRSLTRLRSGQTAKAT